MRGPHSATLLLFFIGIAALRQTSAAYYYVEQVGCECRFPETDQVCTPILNMADCQTAASELAVTYAAKYQIASNDFPGGCYLYKDYILYFNNFTNVTGAWYQGYHRHSMCEVVDEVLTTPGPLTYDCDIGVPRTLVRNRKTGTCEGTLHGESCVYECENGWYNADDATVDCVNGTFSVSDPSSVGCASDVDGDGFDFDMDDGETSDTLSNKVFGCATAEDGEPVWSSVMGGQKNTASGCKAAVVGGEKNTAKGNEATIGGGTYNTANKNYATVAGGRYNTAGGVGSMVAGGAYTSGGGQHNYVAGGYGHRATADTFSIAGGWGNSALSGRYSPFVGGGKECYAKGSYSSVLGGYRNTAVSLSSSIGGGYLNAVLGRYGAVAGGSRNTVNGRSSTVMGHRGFVSEDYSLALAFMGSECAVRSEKTVGMCSEHVYVNGVDLVDELTAGSLYDSRRLLVEDLEHRAQSLVTQKTADHVRREFECDPEQDWDEAEKKFCCRKLELPCDDSTADLLAIALKQLQRLRQELDMNAQEIQHLEVLLQNSVDGSLKHQTPTP